MSLETFYYSKLELALLKRKNLVLLEKEDFKLEKSLFSQLKLDLFNLGYSIGSDLEKTIKTLSEDSFNKFRIYLLDSLSVINGSHIKHKPILTHVIYKEENSIPEYNSSKLTVLNLGTKEDFTTLFNNLVSSKTNISSDDVDFIKSYIFSFEKELSIPVITSKEILAVVFKSLLGTKLGLEETKKILSPYIKTATDVLRLITSLSTDIEPDLSLKKPVKFHLTNQERKFVMSTLEGLNYIEEDMLRYINRWKVIGKLLHIGSSKNKYPKTFKAFDILRNNPKSIRSFYSKVNSMLIYLNYINSKFQKVSPCTINDLLSLLKTRPGEFARIIDLLLRKNIRQDLILSAFEEIADKVSSTVLLQMKGNFKNRDKVELNRFFLPKGKLSNIKVFTDINREFIPKNYLNRIISIIDNALIKMYSEKESLGKVYVDPILSNFIIPSSLRSASSSKNVITSGSSFDGTDKDYLRMFVYWKNKECKEEDSGDYNNGDRVDIDISAIGFDEEWNCQGYLDYTSLSMADSYHSEDITDAPNGATEFIDISKSSFLEKNIRYVVMSLYSYTEHTFNEIECFAGLMERNSINSDDLYDPKSISFKYDVCSEATQSIPLIYDLELNKVIWCDISAENILNTVRSVSGTKNLLSNVGSVMVSYKDKKVNLLELVSLHSNRGEFYFEKEDDIEYDLILDETFAYNLDEIMSKWL